LKETSVKESRGGQEDRPVGNVEREKGKRTKKKKQMKTSKQEEEN